MNKHVKLLADAALERPTTAQELDRLAELARTVLGPRRVKRAVAMARAEKRDRRAERREKVGAIREAVMARSYGFCQVPECPCAGSDMHHAIGGGRRRAAESVDSCVWLCRDHHRAVHSGDRETLEKLVIYCTSKGMAPASRALEMRLAKIEEARSSARRDET